MRKYDLHIHSKFSDGDYTLEEIVDKLKENGIDIFSITDHDNADSIRTMQYVDKYRELTNDNMLTLCIF